LIIKRTSVGRTKFAAHYRLFYVAFAAASFVAAWILTAGAGEISVWSWEGPWRALQWVCWGMALFLFCMSFRFQSVLAFLGFRFGQTGTDQEHSEEKLITYGIYGVIRHPQFAAGLLFLWTRDLTDTGLVINLVLSTYLLLGSKIEENKLAARFGDQYVRYRQEVPAFIPRKIPRLGALFCQDR
jgi:protein-S-isoprenylcysteine O-methyltransferase Ste14